MNMRNLFFFETQGGGGDGGQGNGGDQSQVDSQSGQGSGGDSTQTVPASEAQAARREAANYRTQLRERERELDELKKGQLSDQERVVKERDDLKESEVKLQKDNRDLRVALLAQKVGIVDPAVASTLLDWSAIKDETSEMQIETALKALVKDKPYLAGEVAGGSDGGAGTGSGGNLGDMNARIRAASGR